MQEIKERLMNEDVHHQYAPCRFCGQMHMVHGTVEYGREELERLGTGQCQCPDAAAERKRQERRKKAEKTITEWIPGDCDEQGFIMTLVDRVLSPENHTVAITVKHADDTQITIKEMSNGNIRLTEKRGRKMENEI